jgi:probable rRNA maturation factor
MKQSVIIYNDSGRALPLSDAAIRHLLKKTLSALEREAYLVQVIALDDEALREMKKTYFHEDLYTDVISFVLEDDPLLEGELYCSPARIRENAAAYSESEAREFARILIHGAAHLCGYRDGSPGEKQQMRELEDRFLNTFYDKI